VDNDAEIPFDTKHLLISDRKPGVARPAAELKLGQKSSLTLCFFEQYHINFGMKEKPRFPAAKDTL
jgi:hypothetical protein